MHSGVKQQRPESRLARYLLSSSSSASNGAGMEAGSISGGKGSTASPSGLQIVEIEGQRIGCVLERVKIKSLSKKE